MVSFWPWRAQDNSPASFEKTLSALAAKITKSQSQLDSLRQSGRRYKALWTLYTSFAYLLCFVIMFLVVGWQNWGVTEYTALSASPVVIFAVRRGIVAFYDYRLETITQRLEDQQAERSKTIDKLKTATLYNSTQELLEKYGGVAPKPKKPATPKSPKASTTPKPGPGRTPMGPPATANIARPGQSPSQPPTPQPGHQGHPTNHHPHHQLAPSPIPPPGPTPQAEFAPNAFNNPPQYSPGQQVNMGGNWYDRVLDLLMGEDETAPKNRVVLICQTCRLVNGQAPPGTKALAEIGKWRCYGCGTMNGEEDEAAKVVKEIKEIIEGQETNDSSGESIKPAESGPELEKDIKEESEDEGTGDEAEIEEVKEVRPKKSRAKSHKKKN